MKRSRIRNMLAPTAATLLLAILAGCGKPPHPPPPLEEPSLLLRWFENMRTKRSAAAVEQGLKFRAMLPDNAYIDTIIDTQRANEFTALAITLAQSGKYDEALREIRRGTAQYPLNRMLANTEAELLLLQGLHRQIQAVLAARTADELETALNRLAPTVRAFPPESRLHRALAVGRHRGWRLRRESAELWRRLIPVAAATPGEPGARLFVMAPALEPPEPKIPPVPSRKPGRKK